MKLHQCSKWTLDISEKVLEGRKKKYLEDMGFSSTEDVDRYPYFTYHVKVILDASIYSSNDVHRISTTSLWTMLLKSARKNA